MNRAKGIREARTVVAMKASSLRRRLARTPTGRNLESRVAELERALQEQRQLSMRVAQLTDIVQELLIPVVDRDEERLHRLLKEYAASL